MTAPILNAIARGRNRDLVHRIRYWKDGAVQSITLAELDRQAVNVASHLHELGIRRGDRIGMMATNSLSWVLVDLAALKLGALIAGLEFGKFVQTRAVERYGLRLLLSSSIEAPHAAIVDIARVSAWAEAPATASVPDHYHDGYTAIDAWGIRFTSGTAGEPKGLLASVGSIEDSITAVQEMFEHGTDDNLLIYHLLSIMQQRYWIYSALTYGHDVSVTTVAEVFSMARAVHPTVIMGVPAFFDELKARLEASAELPPGDLEARRRAIQDAFGGRIRYLWTGSAPASRSVLDFYNACGVPLYEGYGSIEACIVTKNSPRAYRIGSVGKVLPNKTVRFDDRNVIIIGSRHPVARGYTWCGLGDTERMFLPSGEVVSQDIGYLDEDGFLYVQGRADDIIVLSTGRNVIVREVEERIKDHPAVHECVLYGQGRRHVVALISLVRGAVDEHSIQAHIDSINRSLYPDNRVGGFVICVERFSQDNGLLTAQSKPIRRRIYARYAADLDALYQPRPSSS